MRSITKPDGVIEVALADCLSGPGDCFGKLHGNSTVGWVRLLGEPWRRTWVRSLGMAHRIAEQCETAAKVIEVLTEGVGANASRAV